MKNSIIQARADPAQGQKYRVSKIYPFEDIFSHDINSFLVDPYGSLPSRTRC